MTIDQIVERLKEIRLTHGGEVQVEFDCPNCFRSFIPTKVVLGPPIATMRDENYHARRQAEQMKNMAK